MTAMSQRLDELERKVNSHDAFIDGNGKPGAKVHLATLETNYANIVAQMNEIKRRIDNMTTALWGVVGSVVIGLILFAATGVLPRVFGGGP